VVAIDGCGSECASRMLTAKGMRVEAIGLHELGVRIGDNLDERARTALLARVVGRLQAPASPIRAVRRRPTPPPVGARGKGGAHTSDDYLYAIYTLTSPVVACGALASDSPTLAAHVAHALSISRASAGAMLAQLEASGQIERGPVKEIVLTPAGRAAAGRVVRRHRVLERFLTDFLDYPPAQSHDLALQIREAFDEEMIDRIASRLAPPARCPHGWPLDPEAERAEAADLVALSALAPRAEATTAALTEQDGELLARLDGLGLRPGTQLEVLDESAGTLTIAIEGQCQQLHPDTAAAVIVRRRAPNPASAPSRSAR